MISDCGKYRYRLWRHIGGSAGPVLFVMLNPSTADHAINDPTIRRCMSFAKKWDHSCLLVGNLFAFRATDPEKMRLAKDPIGPDNYAHLAGMSGHSCRTIAAWGNYGSFKNQGDHMVGMLDTDWSPLEVLKMTKLGNPCHPLYLPKDTKPFRYRDWKP